MKYILIILVAVVMMACNNIKDKKLSEIMLNYDPIKAKEMIKNDLSEQEYKKFMENGVIISENESKLAIFNYTIQEIIDYKPQE